MGNAKDGVFCNVKAIRRAKGLSQAELADLVGVRRQAIYDMESGRYTPNTAIALRLAGELGCRVEDLFFIEQDAGEYPVSLAEHVDTPGARLSVVRIEDRLVAYPQDGRWLLCEGFQSADGLLQPIGGRVRMLQDEARLGKKILLLGCDPAFSILHAHVARHGGGAEILCRFASSRRAVEGLKAGTAHLAATHLHNTGKEEANVLMAKSILKDSKAMVVGFSLFEEGLMLAQGNPFNLQSVADLSKNGVRFINREHGAAIRVLLDDQLRRHGIPADTILGYEKVTTSHIEGAQAVAFGLADAALGLRALAAAYRLDFFPIQFVRCDLIIGHQFLDHPAVKILLDVLQTQALRKDLGSLPGYETTMTGTIIGEV
ncbi:MAG: helix-turn-helix domain-containing protein [Proteobacteria bacterium]|nr:helix-turn-helix domain-containing protein [Pseudomonadota bacterium]